MKKTVSHKEAWQIMGDSMLGIPEIERYFGGLTNDQRDRLEIIPFPEEVLNTRAKTHVLVADVGFSILDVQARVRKELFYKHNWYEGQEFAKRIETARWRLIRKSPVEDSFYKPWVQQCELINRQVDEIPSARQVIYMIVLHFLAMGEQLFKTCYVRTNDVGLLGCHIIVGFMVEYFLVDDCLLVNYWHNDDLRSVRLGIASGRKVL